MQRHHHTAQTIVHLIVELVISGSANPCEVVENLDYSFDHEAIASSEIIGIKEQ